MQVEQAESHRLFYEETVTNFGGRSGTCTITLTKLYKDLTKQFFGGKLPQYRVTSSKEVSGPWRGRSTTRNLCATGEVATAQTADFTDATLAPPLKFLLTRPFTVC